MTERAAETSIRIGLVDDQKTIVSALKEQLEYRDLDVCLTACDSDSFFSSMKGLDIKELPHLVITDINMPGMSGVELVRRGKALYPGVKFLMLTVNDDDETIFNAIKAGAEGYLMKDERFSVIADQIVGMISHGKVPMTSRIARKILDLLSRSKAEDGQQPDLDRFDLTEREKDVLWDLVEGREYKQIADHLSISPHTVRKHIANIYHKLHVSSKAQVINLVHGNLGKRVHSNDGVKTLLVDDHQIVLDGLSMVLGKIPRLDIVRNFDNGNEVLDYLRGHDVDLVISDVNMPGINGIQLARMIRQDYPKIKIMMLTVSDDTSRIAEARSVGIQGYMLKNARKNELVQAIDTIMSGGSYYFDTPPVTL